GVPDSIALATDYPRPLVQRYDGATHTFSLGKPLTEQVKRLAEQQNATLYIALLAAFNVLLYRYTGQEDLCVGSPIANRQYGETEGLIGMFVNTLALRSQVKGEDSFTTVLEHVKTTCLEAYEHQDTPFEKIVERVQPRRNMAMTPLFQIMVILQNTPMDILEEHIQPYPLGNDLSKFDLTVEFTDTPDGLTGSIEYSTALYKHDTIERMVANFLTLCESLVTHPDTSVRDLDCIHPAEQQRLLVNFNNTKKEYAKERCIHELFAEQVERTPDNIAVVDEHTSLSYRQLYDRSVALALYLQSMGVGPDSLVGLCMDKSVDMLVGMLGILQAGGAYVPLDPAYPDERLAYMLKDCGAGIVLTQENLKEKLLAFVGEATQLVALDKPLPEVDVHAVLRKDVTSTHLAYVIYTSGSTGKPKGVMVEHKSLQSLCAWHQQAFGIDATSRATQTANIAFDAAVWEIWPYLLGSACIVLVKNELCLDMPRLHRFIVDQQITHCFLVTPLAQQFLQLEHIDTPLRYLLTGGDKLATYEDRQYPFTVVNNYGPTEATVVATSFPITGSFATQTIGHPIANTRIYILDAHNNLQAIGIPGELHIAGDGLARGYLNRPELTEQAFIPDPFVTSTGAPSVGTSTDRMYKTGDLARWLPDGTIEYLGRIDTQIKIRGFRIEAGEIEAQLNQHPDITDCAVVAQGHEANKQLIAFYVEASNGTDDTPADLTALLHDQLKAYLLQVLPEYMVPVAFVRVEAIPLTPNGKVDRRVLESRTVDIESSQTYLAPRNGIEQQLVAIWAEVLHVAPEKIGINDNFFELGGHSLLATQLVSRIRTQLGSELPLKALFEQGTIARLADVISQTSADTRKIPPILPIDRSQLDRLPLSFAQERLWFIDQLEPGSAGYNVPGAVRIRSGLDIDMLEQAFNHIIARHDNLRTIFPSHDGQAQQVILDKLDFTLERIDLGSTHYLTEAARHEDAKRYCQAEASTPFDLTCGPLIRGKVITLSPFEHILMLTLHHIISDGWSIGVLVTCLCYSLFYTHSIITS
ncbi:MAG: amino acid adenylation domain-containing protein, partial [Sphingobacteriales bacterium]